LTLSIGTALQRQIDCLVYELYGLTEEEIGIVEGGDVAVGCQDIGDTLYQDMIDTQVGVRTKRFRAGNTTRPARQPDLSSRGRWTGTDLCL